MTIGSRYPKGLRGCTEYAMFTMMARHHLICMLLAVCVFVAVLTYDVFYWMRTGRGAHTWDPAYIGEHLGGSLGRYETRSRMTDPFGVLDSAAQDDAGPGGLPKLALMLDRMTIEEKIGQVTQLDIQSVLHRGYHLKLNETAALMYARMGIGSFLNSPASGGPRAGISSPSSNNWRTFLQDLKDVYKSVGMVPPIFGVDSMHGANYVRDAIVFPHALNLAASFNPMNAYRMGRASAEATRNAGMHWVFAPVMDVAMAPRFPRVYETYGEDPWLVATMGVALVQGLQGQPLSSQPVRQGAPRDEVPVDLSREDVVAACMKHFVGYMASRSGHDRAPGWVPEVLLRAYFLPPFAAAVRAGVASAMSAYSSADGLPMTASSKWTKRWLRSEARFEGMLVTDWLNIYNLLTDHHSAANGLEAVQMAMSRSSTDMAMVPGKGDEFIADLTASVRSGKVSKERLDAAVLRVLELKARVGLLGPYFKSAPYESEPRKVKPLAADVRLRHVADSRRAAVQSITLVKNARRVLPLDLSNAADAVAVIGPNARSRKNLLGGWSVHWQGPQHDREVPHVATVAEAFLKYSSAAVVSATGVSESGEVLDDNVEGIVSEATKAVVFVYGEGVYAELGGDVTSFYLPHSQLDLATRVRALCDKQGIPLVGVYVGGRDRLLTHFDSLFDAHLVAFYPGPYGGEAIAAIVSGRVSPSARLPITLHRDDTQNMPYWQSHIDYQRNMTPAWPLLTPLYPFGHGLSYVEFKASNLVVEIVPAANATSIATAMPLTSNNASSVSDDPDEKASHALSGKPGVSCIIETVGVDFCPGDKVLVKVTVSNLGDRFAAMPVLLFVSDDFRILPPELRLLKGARRVELEPGKSTTVSFELLMDDFGFETNSDVIEKPGRMVQPGSFTLSVEGLTAQVRLVGDPLDESSWVRLSTYV